ATSGKGSVVEQKLQESQVLAAEAQEAKEEADRKHADAKAEVESRGAAQKDLVAASDRYAASAERGAKEIADLRAFMEGKLETSKRAIKNSAIVDRAFKEFDKEQEKKKKDAKSKMKTSSRELEKARSKHGREAATADAKQRVYAALKNAFDDAEQNLRDVRALREQIAKETDHQKTYRLTKEALRSLGETKFPTADTMQVRSERPSAA